MTMTRTKIMFTPVLDERRSLRVRSTSIRTCTYPLPVLFSSHRKLQCTKRIDLQYIYYFPTTFTILIAKYDHTAA